MIEIGKYNLLEIVKYVDFGAYLDGGEFGEILLPIRQVPPTAKIGEKLEVFLYKDSEDRLIATTFEPYAIVGEYAYLQVRDLNKIGAFLDWGLAKDLLVPFKEQKQDMEAEKFYFVYVFLEPETKRIAASSKIEKFIDLEEKDYTENQEVDILIHSITDIGFKVIVNNKHWGLLYKSETFDRLKIGEKRKAYIKKLREDQKLDVTITKPGIESRDIVEEKILGLLKLSNNFLPFNDKSSPDDIYKKFGVSKKLFKKAIGGLYKEKIIMISDQGITLIG